MGKIRRKFEVEFKRRLVEQIASGQITLSAAARQYQVSPSVIQRWRTQYEANQLVDRPSSHERALEAENERLKAKVGDLVMQIDHLKKLQSWMERNRNVDTAVITGKNWGRYRRGAK
jgi:transposase-like protein